MENKTQIIKLSEPLRVGEKDVEELTMRALRVGDLLDAYDVAPEGASSSKVEAYMFAMVCSVPYEDLRNLSLADYSKLLVARDFLSGAGASPAEKN